MSERARRAFDDWKQADARAREAEAKLARAWDNYFETRSAPPDASLLDEVSSLRAIANDRLTVAMLSMNLPRDGDAGEPGK